MSALLETIRKAKLTVRKGHIQAEGAATILVFVGFILVVLLARDLTGLF